MGLQVTVCIDIAQVAAFTGWDNVDVDMLDYAFAVPHEPLPPHKYRIKGSGLAPGYVYAGTPAMSFSMGSYGHYGEWRWWLCANALGLYPESVWRYGDSMQGKPFVELIDFTDCDGVMAGEAVAKLADDFADYAERATYWPDEDGYSLRKYDQWLHAFVMANAHHGAVVFS